ncbi:MAG TPA: hypothetical protein QF753_00855 [Victivallales bacterium]|jgi:hypothetical protein|nr:hypothetical protein [Victivallales bacterium]
MRIGDTVYVCSEGHKFKSVITGETGKFWTVKTPAGASKYSKNTLKKVEYPYFDGCYIIPF